jgi:starvation-inducible DNA-binding protein
MIEMPVAEKSYLPPISEYVRVEVGVELNAILVDLVDLSLWGKQLHWSVTGPLFRALHPRLDELVDSWHEMADTIAERAVTIGYWPNGQAQAIVGSEHHVTVERGPLEDQLVVGLLADRLQNVSARVRARLDHLGSLDLVSQDVVIGIVRTLEEQLWMSRAQLPSASDSKGSE